MLTNTSTNAWAGILSFKITIGDASYDFDHLGVPPRDAGDLPEFSTDPDNDGTYVNSTPDHQDGGIRSDFISFDFTGFDKGDAFTFISDVDPDNIDVGEDFRHIFWNNGQIRNSEITVEFAAIPLPGSVLLGTIGIAIVGQLRRRRML